MNVQFKRPTRDEREQQLRAMVQTAQGREQVNRIFLSLFPLGVLPPVGVLVIQTILNHEYPANRSM